MSQTPTSEPSTNEHDLELMERRKIEIAEEHWDEVVDWLNKPRVASHALANLLKRKPPWDEV